MTTDARAMTETAPLFLLPSFLFRRTLRQRQYGIQAIFLYFGKGDAR